MEFMTGVNKKDTVEISEILAGDFEGKTVKVNGAVHTIRDMGEVAFVVLRKREGLLQCVFEEGSSHRGSGRCSEKRGQGTEWF